MTTIIERQADHSDTSSALTMIVAIIAIITIVGFALYAMRLPPFGPAQVVPTDDNPGANLQIEGEVDLPQSQQ